MKTIFVFTILILQNYASVVLAQESEWELVRSEEGINIYSRKTATGRGLKELKVVAEVKGSLSAIISAFSEKSKFPKWVYGCGSAQMLEVVSAFETYHYQTTEMPWPVQNRDLILHTVIKQHPQTKVITIDSKGVPDYRPENKDFIRIRDYKAFWVLTPKPNGIVEILYTVNFDPGGILPDWVVNMVSADGPLKTVKNLRVVVAEYKNIKLNFILE
jgi:hypothetical protein